MQLLQQFRLGTELVPFVLELDSHVHTAFLVLSEPNCPESPSADFPCRPELPIKKVPNHLVLIMNSSSVYKEDPMNSESVVGFITELYERLTEDKELQLPSEDSLFNEVLEVVEVNRIYSWREKVDAATVDLAKRWLGEEVNLETMLPKWSDQFCEDDELSSVFRKISDLVATWKKVLTEVLYRDSSIFSIPTEMLSPDKLLYSPHVPEHMPESGNSSEEGVEIELFAGDRESDDFIERLNEE